MPSKQLETLRKRAPRKTSKKDVERYWEEAKKQADKAAEKGQFKKDSGQYWAYVMKVTMRRMGFKDKEKVSATYSIFAYYIDHQLHSNTNMMVENPHGRRISHRTLYLSRKLLNANDLVAWAKSQGFKQTLEPDDFHVTVANSKKPIDWSAVGYVEPTELKEQSSSTTMRIDNGERSVEPLGDKGALVLKFAAPGLVKRWKEVKAAGASWDYPDYHPHVTISYTPQEVDLSRVQPYDGPLEFGPEIFAEVQEDWSDNIQEQKIEARLIKYLNTCKR